MTRSGDFTSLIEIAAARYGMSRTFSAIRICHEARKIIASSVDFEVKLVFKDSLLRAFVANSGQAQKIQMLAHEIVKRLGAEGVKRVVVKVA